MEFLFAADLDGLLAPSLVADIMANYEEPIEFQELAGRAAGDALALVNRVRAIVVQR